MGTLYGWSLSGRVPAHYGYNRHGSATLLWPDGREEAWPETAFVRTSQLSHDERRGLEQVVWELEKRVDDDSAGYKQGSLETVKALLARPVVSPHIAYQAPFPDAGLLDEGEKYLLHRWLLKKDKQYRLVYAYPVWLVVTARDSGAGGLARRADNLCPRCDRVVRAEHLEGDGSDRSHRWCHEFWEDIGWDPIVAQERC